MWGCAGGQAGARGVGVSASGVVCGARGGRPPGVVSTGTPLLHRVLHKLHRLFVVRRLHHVSRGVWLCRAPSGMPLPGIPLGTLGGEFSGSLALAGILLGSEHIRGLAMECVHVASTDVVVFSVT